MLNIFRPRMFTSRSTNFMAMCCVNLITEITQPSFTQPMYPLLIVHSITLRVLSIIIIIRQFLWIFCVFNIYFSIITFLSVFLLLYNS